MASNSGNSSRRPLIAGNWKMNLTLRESTELVRAIIDGISKETPAISRGFSGDTGSLFIKGGSLPEIWVAPPFTALTAVAAITKGSSVHLAAQNMYSETSGAFTGEVSPAQVKDSGCQGVILGHSERRRLFGDTDASVRKKLQAAIAQKLIPIVCVGETLQEREAHKTFQILETQVRGALEGIATGDLENLVVAYEPVWAIGTGKTATPAQAQEAHAFIRKMLTQLHGEALAQSIRILYGGSVTPENIDGLMSQSDIDGALVGGASLKSASFLRIIQYENISMTELKRGNS